MKNVPAHWGGLICSFLSGLFKGDENDDEGTGNEKGVMYAQNKESLDKSVWDKVVGTAARLSAWLDGLFKAKDITETEKTAIDSMKQMDERSKTWDSLQQGIKNGTLNQQQIRTLDDLRLNADRDVTGPPARVGEKGIDLAY
jgi:hypothetical protein